MLIVSYNSAAVIETCLASLARVAPEVPVAVREHGTDPDSLEMLRSIAAGHTSAVRVERDPTNPGYAAGCNALARSSSATWLVVLNPDTEVVAWPWSELDPPRSSIVGPTYVESGHPGDHSGVSYRVRDEIARSWFRRRGRRPDGLGFVSGAALLIDADSFTRLGGFDERYFMFYEDIDLCLRANDAGISTLIAPNWVVRHARAHSTRARFAESLVWSYESGCRFHSSRNAPVGAYRAYVAFDALGRAMLHGLRLDRRRSRAYLALTRRAVSDLVGRRPA